jgi:hypothetical protein
MSHGMAILLMMRLPSLNLDRSIRGKVSPQEPGRSLDSSEINIVRQKAC